MKAELGGGTPTSHISIPNPNPNFFNTSPHRHHFSSPSPSSSSSSSSLAATASGLRGCLGSLDGSSIEKLLLHCATALEDNDVTLAQQVMWVLNNAASASGDPNQRLAYWFLRALISRASMVCPSAVSFHAAATSSARNRAMTVTELAGYVDLMPWHRFGFSAANGAIRRAIQHDRAIHILDFSTTHCMQWPTLIDELAKRPEGEPCLRITVPEWRPPVPPFLNVSIEELGHRLANFAKSKEVQFEFHVIKGSSPDSGHELDPSLLNLREGEALVVNCQNWLRYLPSDANGGGGRDGFLDMIREINPRILTIVDEDADLDSPSLATRITACFDYLWIPFDALDTFLPKNSNQRMEYEADIGRKIENVVGQEGGRRIEGPESGVRTAQRVRRVGFVGAGFCEETVREVRCLLEGHASGWGMKRDNSSHHHESSSSSNNNNMVVLTWKGHNTVFATAWTPCSSSRVDG